MRYLIVRTSNTSLPASLPGVTNLIVAAPKDEDDWEFRPEARGDVNTIDDLMQLVGEVGKVVIGPVGYQDLIDKTLPVIEIYDTYRE